MFRGESRPRFLDCVWGGGRPPCLSATRLPSLLPCPPASRPAFLASSPPPTLPPIRPPALPGRRGLIGQKCCALTHSQQYFFLRWGRLPAKRAGFFSHSLTSYYFSLSVSVSRPLPPSLSLTLYRSLALAKRALGLLVKTVAHSARAGRGAGRGTCLWR